MLASTVRRLASIPIKGIQLHANEHTEATAYERAIAKSFLISSDMAHGEYIDGSRVMVPALLN
jgi:aspartyl aminopeptidase